MFVDFHTHLDCYKDSLELENQLKNFEGIIISASMNEKSFTKNIELSTKVNKINPKIKIFPTFGIHPQYILSTQEDLSVYNQLCNESKIIGEIGMDFCWYKDASPDQQERVFRYFLAHCNQYKKYCVIHTKDAEEQICKILEDYPNVKPIIHWYDGPKSVFKTFIQRGYYFTFGCETIRSEHIKSLLKQTPKNRILAETDNPDSEPWLGGKDNSISLVKRIYADISNVLNLSIEETTQIINENSLRILKESNLI